MRLRLAVAPVFVLVLAFLLCSSVHLQAQKLCDDAYLKGLPAPLLGSNAHRVIQLVNCTDQVLLGAANAAHRIKEPGYPVFPREKTWVMQPFNPNNPADHSNILTIDIPQQWENTVGTKKAGANAPNIWARTGCRYEVATNRAVCETGGCNDAYDCSAAGYGASPFTTFTEWTFYQPTANPKVFLDNPDVSAVNGASLAVDILPVGGDSRNPLGLDWGWLAYNVHLAQYGQDPRDTKYCGTASVSQSDPGFLLKRSDIDKSGLLKFEIIDENGNLACLNNDPNCAVSKADNAMACLNNCGFYKYPTEQGAKGCDPTNPGCLGWQTFCAGDPDLFPPSDFQCSTDKDCAKYAQQHGGGVNGVYAACWHNDSQNPTKGFCGARAFYAQDISNCDTIKTDDGHYWGAPTNTVPCSFPYQSYNDLTGIVDWSTQPPYDLCSSVKIGSTPLKCIGDDTMHMVLHGAYTWPNDPEVFGGDSPIYRIVYGPAAQGGTTVPITPSTPGIALCSDLPANYMYESNHNNCSIEIDHEGAVFGIGVANLNKDGKYISNGTDWPCELDQRGSATAAGILCRWNPYPGNCTPPTIDKDVAQSACGRIDSGTSLVSTEITPSKGEPLFVEVTIPKVLNSAQAPATPTGCAASWQPVAGGSLTMFTDQGYLAWYQGTANTDQACQVTVKLASSNPAELKVYGVPNFNGTVETTSSLTGSFVYPPRTILFKNSVSAGIATTKNKDGDYLVLGSLLQVNQQPTPITYWNNWLTNNLIYPGIDCLDPNGQINDNFCPTDDGTDYLPGHGPQSANADAGHQHIGGKGIDASGAHSLQRAGQVIGSFNWGGVAIYLQLKSDNEQKLAQAGPEARR